MRETRLQTQRRAKIRKELVQRLKGVMAKTKSKMANHKANQLDDKPVDKGPFPLLRLPTEIQTMIYELALTDNDKIFMLDNCGTPPMARITRDLRKTVLPIFLAGNTFRLYTEEEPSSDTTKLYDVNFKIRPETMAWLSPLGNDTPLFKSLIVHFGSSGSTELQFDTRARKGLIVTHEKHCRFCHDDDLGYPLLPQEILKTLIQAPLLNRVMDNNEIRKELVRGDHEKICADLDHDLFHGVGQLNRKALALSLDDINRIEDVLSLGRTLFAITTHTANSVRLKETPLLVTYQKTIYLLRRESDR